MSLTVLILNQDHHARRATERERSERPPRGQIIITASRFNLRFTPVALKLMAFQTMASSLPDFFSHPDITPVILSFMDTPSLAVCLRVNRAFFDLAAPVLYHTVDISSQPEVAYVGSRTQAESLHVIRGRFQQTPPKSKLLTHTRVATFYLESARRHPAPPGLTLALPTLRVLHVFFPDYHLSTRRDLLTRYVSLLRRVRPRTLVVHPNFSRPASVEECAPVVTKQTTHPIELVISLREREALVAVDDIVAGRHTMVERAVVVFISQFHLPDDFRLVPRLTRYNHYGQEDWAWEGSRMVAALAALCRITTGTVTLVNTSCFDREWLGCPPDISTSHHFESALRKTIDSAMSSDPAEEPSNAQGSLEFMGMKEFLGSHHWAREFAGEVRAWLE